MENLINKCTNEYIHVCSLFKVRGHETKENYLKGGVVEKRLTTDLEGFRELVKDNFNNSTFFCLLYLQVRNNQNRSETCQKFEKSQIGSDDDVFKKCWQNAQILKTRVSVSDFKSRVSGFLMKSRCR